MISSSSLAHLKIAFQPPRELLVQLGSCRLQHRGIDHVPYQDVTEPVVVPPADIWSGGAKQVLASQPPGDGGQVFVRRCERRNGARREFQAHDRSTLE